MKQGSRLKAEERSPTCCSFAEGRNADISMLDVWSREISVDAFFFKSISVFTVAVRTDNRLLAVITSN